MDEKYNLDKFAIPANHNGKDNECFMSTDSEDAFKKSLIYMPADWSYRTKQVRYNTNSLGYRTKELEDINQNNFFIAYGCSFTFGIGLAEDELWTNTVANELGIECLNLGMGGAGMDLIYLNTLTYLKNTHVRPKFVIIQCPEVSRLLLRSLDHYLLLGPNFEASRQHVDMYKESIRDNSYLYTAYLAWQGTMVFWKTAGVPVYFWTQNVEWRKLIPEVEFNVSWPTEEEKIPQNRARDLQHFPASYQIRTGKLIAQQLKNDPKFGIGPIDSQT
jgi:hypothetical protein